MQAKLEQNGHEACRNLCRRVVLLALPIRLDATSRKRDYSDTTARPEHEVYEERGMYREALRACQTAASSSYDLQLCLHDAASKHVRAFGT